MTGWTIVAAWLVGCGMAPVEGKVIDGMTNAPITGVSIRATATNPQDVSPTCAMVEAPLGAEGQFSLSGMCAGSPYDLQLTDGAWWLAELDQVPDGGFAAPETIKVWRTPSGSGVYKLEKDGKIAVLKTGAGVETETVLNGEQKVHYPANQLKSYPTVGPGEYLLLVGKGSVNKLKIEPLVKSGPRKFGTDDRTVKLDSWEYVGFKFEDDTTFEKVEAKLDDSKVLTKEKGERVTKWIPADALPAGRYAMLEERRMYMFEFGGAK